MSERLFVYKVTHDAGGAPCAEDGVLSLAICKPAIRSSAEVGDWIFGIGGVDLGHRLIYIARITTKLTKGDYFQPAFAGRRDCIYQWKGGKLGIRRNARYHSDGSEMKRDVGDPSGSKANVLVSDDFRYLGGKGKRLDLQKFPSLVDMLTVLRRGHRVNHSHEVTAELMRLRDKTWSAYRVCIVGKPSQPIPKRDGVCSKGEIRGQKGDEFQ